MSVISKINQLAKLKRKAYRDAFVEEHVKTGLPFQIRALREQREWSQADLGEKTGMRQNAISRLEKSDYGSLSVNTLIRLASAFDVALLVKFVGFRKLLAEFDDLSMEALEVNSFDDEVDSLTEIAVVGDAGTTYALPAKSTRETPAALWHVLGHYEIPWSRLGFQHGDLAPSNLIVIAPETRDAINESPNHDFLSTDNEPNMSPSLFKKSPTLLATELIN